MSSARRRITAGFTLIEAITSIVLVAVMFAAVMQTVGASRITNYKTRGQQRGVLLARQLLAEILQQGYEDPDVPTVALGLDAGESGSNRYDFDDVDDYDGWSASQIQDKDGLKEGNLQDWSREVSVTWVNPTNLGQVSLTETGAKKVVVTAKHHGLVMAEFTAVRTAAFPQVDR